MDSRFIMGSLGQVTGQKIAHLFQKATQERLPNHLYGFWRSADARRNLFPYANGEGV